MKNIFADVASIAARSVSPFNVAPAADTAPTVNAYLNNLGRDLTQKFEM